MYVTVTRAGESRRRVAHTRDVRDALAATLLHLVDAETGQRGYIITGRRQYLVPFAAGTTAVASDLAALRRLTTDDSAQRRRVDRLASLAYLKQAELVATVRLREQAGLAAAARVVDTDHGKATMDSVRAVVAAMDAAERRALSREVDEEERRRRLALATLLVGTGAAVLIALLINGLLARYAAQQAAAARALDEQNAMLQDQAVELELQQQQLQDQAIELEEANGELQAGAGRLEERTRLAEAARLEAEAANAAKSQFLTTMSHELRTPLNAITGYADLMELGLRGPVTGAQLEDLRRVKKSSRHLLSLINDILNFARLDAGQVEFHREAVPLEAALDAVELLVTPQLAAKGLAYEIAPHAPALTAWADADKLQQILLNLLSNAIKFTDAGAITAACEGDAATVGVRVSDTGRGIPADEHERIFDPFVQVGRHSLHESQKGVGLGLAISRNLARAMGGDLVVVASEPGRGSTFLLTLPRAPQGVSAPATDIAPARQLSGGVGD
jgi:signal transduction histidine kinase